jgi:hypothetical protein
VTIKLQIRSPYPPGFLSPAAQRPGLFGVD